MENGIIEEVQVDVGGLPFLDFVAAEVKIRDGDGSAAYYAMVEVFDTLTFFESRDSIYHTLIENNDSEEDAALLERCKVDEYGGYRDFYAALEQEAALSVRSRIRKALICLVRATQEETEVLKHEMLGKPTGALTLPSSDMEHCYEEMKITGRWEF